MIYVSGDSDPHLDTTYCQASTSAVEESIDPECSQRPGMHRLSRWTMPNIIMNKRAFLHEGPLVLRDASSPRGD